MAKAVVACVRCGRPDAPALPRPPLPGATGQEVVTKTCADCWKEWEAMEVMVINELRLNFMDPRAQDVLERHMRSFLFGEELEPELEKKPDPRPE